MGAFLSGELGLAELPEDVGDVDAFSRDDPLQDEELEESLRMAENFSLTLMRIHLASYLAKTR